MRSLIRKTGYIILAILIHYIWMNNGPFLAQSRAAEKQPLKIALLPILDVLPYYVADTKGYFKKMDLNVKAIPVGSALERDQLMQAGEIDGMLNEMITTANFNRETIRVKIVIAARKAYPDTPLFRILSSPGSQIDAPKELAKKPIGVSRNTIIDYITERLLSEEGVVRDDIKTRSIPVIPERYQLLVQGQIQAATLPDPLAQSAMMAGAGLVMDDSKYPHFSMSVLTFGIEPLDDRSHDIRLFLSAWNQAVIDINKDPEAYRDLVLKHIRVPKNVQNTFNIPIYPQGEIPTPSQWEDIMDWMISRGLLSHPLPYEGSITSNFLP